jgi:hypothetical protein
MLSLTDTLTIAIFGGDGSFATKISAKFPPVPPFQGFVDEVGPGYGRWVETSDKEFKLTFYAVLLKDGVANGYQRVHSTMILSESGNEFTVHEGHVDSELTSDPAPVTIVISRRAPHFSAESVFSSAGCCHRWKSSMEIFVPKLDFIRYCR